MHARGRTSPEFRQHLSRAFAYENRPCQAQLADKSKTTTTTTIVRESTQHNNTVLEHWRHTSKANQLSFSLPLMDCDLGVEFRFLRFPFLLCWLLFVVARALLRLSLLLPFRPPSGRFVESLSHVYLFAVSPSTCVRSVTCQCQDIVFKWSPRVSREIQHRYGHFKAA